MTDQELRDIVARLSLSLEESKRERDKVMAESKRETDQALRQLSKQMGELGNKFGSFTEGLALPSMEKVFYREFGLDVVQPRARSRQNGRTMEIDVLAYDHPGGSKDVFIIEVKSHLTEEGIEQIKETIAKFPKFFPWGLDRTIYGVIAAVDIPDNVRDKVLKEGLYLARISDDTFTMQVPPGFKPKAFHPNGGTETNGRKKNGAKPARKRGKKARKGSR
jgi:hypothetical protein